MIEFSVEPIAVIFGEGTSGGLLELHNQETSDEVGYEIKPSELAYQRIEDHGSLVTMIARSGGEMVGYATFFVTANIHSNMELYAVHDSIFVRKEYRIGSNSIDFMRFCDTHLVSLGVGNIQWGVPARKGYDRIFSRLGYEKTQYLYRRRVR